MSVTSGDMDARAVAQAGMAALRSGDASSARRQFEQVLAAGKADLGVWYALALACQKLGDMDAMLAAVDKVLEADARHIPSLMLKGDYYARAGDERAALSFYTIVAKFAAQLGQPTPEVAAAAHRAREMKEAYAAKMLAHAMSRLAAAGYRRGQSSERFSHAVDLLSGVRQPYMQQPRSLYFPELPQIQFYPRRDFAWLDAIEAATEDICAELNGVLGSEEDFVPYIQREAARPILDQLNLMDKKEWSAFFLLKDGEPIARNVARCPKTMAAVAKAPMSRVKGRTPSVLFSRLLPGARIPPHHGFLNTRLICHLPLITPPGCHFRVGNDERVWEKGKAWVFDDTIEHEAWNSSNEPRTILIFEIWRPELTEEERKLVAALVESVDEYSGDGKRPWTD